MGCSSNAPVKHTKPSGRRPPSPGIARSQTARAYAKSTPNSARSVNSMRRSILFDLSSETFMALHEAWIGQLTDSVQLQRIKQDRAVDTSEASASARSIPPLPAATHVRCHLLHVRHPHGGGSPIRVSMVCADCHQPFGRTATKVRDALDECMAPFERQRHSRLIV